MALASTTTRVSYDGDGSTVGFDVTFVFWDKDDFDVILRASNGDETTWVRGTQYTVTGGDGQVGSITVNTSPTDYTPATGETLVLLSALAFTQPTNLPDGGSLPSAPLEEQLDKIVRMHQQTSETLDRCLKFPKTDASTISATLPESTDRASARAAFTSTGAATSVTTDVTGAAASAAGKTIIEAASVAAMNVLLLADTFSPANKGADIASASPLVHGTDGNWHDITGTTGFTKITVAADTGYFIYQFDSALVMTDSADLDLGGGNITTATGDVAMFFTLAADTVRLVCYWGEGGQAGFPAFRKGGNIASASPCVIDSDGSYFHITGTTSFSAFTVKKGTLFLAEFDGALTMTHSATLDLPEQAANITTRAGDRAWCYAQADNDVLMIDFIRSKKVFRGSNATVALDALATFAHGLGAIPDVVSVALKCTSDDLGFVASTSDTIFLSSIKAASADQGVTVWADATNVYARSGVQITFVSETDSNDANIDVTKWDWVVAAVLF